MKLYHATDFDNLGKILAEGLKPSAGVIYLAESYEKALAFLSLRNIDTIAVLELEVDIEKCTESFDHNERMFCSLFHFDNCRAWTYDKSIPVEEIDFSKAKKYDRK